MATAPYTEGALFAGVGGFSLAAHLAGLRTAWQVEIDPFCTRVLAHHWPHAARYGDIRTCHDLPYVDVITAGFPCQPFSISGLRKGKTDDRYLIPEMLRCIGETRPRVCVFENVAGFLSIDVGRTAVEFLEALAEMGYDAEWGLFRASDAGAAHQRERWVCVAVGNASSAGRQERQFASLTADARHTAGERVEVEHASGKGRQRRELARLAHNAHGNNGRPVTHGHSAKQRVPESGMGRTAYGLSGRLDSVGLPIAAPNEPQHAHEAPRVVPERLPHHAQQLKALGNAVYVPVFVEVLTAVRMWLEAQDATA